ncbi:antitoxin Xre/MbcA/ParS toxin-binding domain-containing protein [Piscinibacterium candidicorallinum]|uniref:Antitoxin Xre/MbcA/ParS toxin-binding domain-containing protein n=1 Tax=Piscinibacterium candidicorallinum TaxID=1793872 RepID=A0ABV7H962_9BURK
MARVAPPPLTPRDLMRGCSLDELVDLWSADAFAERIAIEHHGIEIRFIKDLAAALRWKPIELFGVLGVPEQSRFARNDYRVQGMPTLRCIELLKTLGLAREIAQRSADPAFAVDAWLGRWLLTPSYAFDGLRPIDWFDTPSGAAYVRHILRAKESGVVI